MGIKKFDVIVADPPWSFNDSLKMSDVKRGAKANYATMTMQQIKGMPVGSICNPVGAVLCLWVPSSLLQEGLDTMKAWGFDHKQTYIWVKVKKSPFKTLTKGVLNLFGSFRAAAKATVKTGDNGSNFKLDFLKEISKFNMNDTLAFGMGRLFRQTHEICLIGTHGKIHNSLMNKSQRSVSFAENLKHSAKPEHLQDSLELMFPKAQKLELFARRIRPDWTCLGNEIDGKDIYDALAVL